MQVVKNKTFALQTDLGLYCRTGMNEPISSIQEHTFQYRRLVYNVVKDTLKMAFPLTRKLIGKKLWKKTIDHFFENHKCQTPQIWKLPLEFLEYYSENIFPFKKDFPFIKELLHYEWLEIEVFMMEDLPIKNFKVDNLNYNEIIVPNPEIKILPLQYPIHLKAIKEIKEDDIGQYFVAIHRDYHTKQVKFNGLSYPFVEMLIKINDDEATIDDLRIIMSKYEKNIEESEQLVLEFLSFTFQNNLTLGFKQ